MLRGTHNRKRETNRQAADDDNPATSVASSSVSSSSKLAVKAQRNVQAVEDFMQAMNHHDESLVLSMFASSESRIYLEDGFSFDVHTFLS